jgi:Trypsin
MQPDVSKMMIFAGGNNLLDFNAQRRQILSCLSHPNFVPLGTSDIAICKVTIPFVFGATVNSIQLNTAPVAKGTNCTLTGWGSTLIFRWLPIPFYNLLAYPMDLKTIGLPVISTDDCKARFGG